MKDTEDQLVQTEELEADKTNDKNESSHNRMQMRQEGISVYNPTLQNYAMSQYQQVASVMIKDEPKEG